MSPERILEINDRVSAISVEVAALNAERQQLIEERIMLSKPLGGAAIGGKR